MNRTFLLWLSLVGLTFIGPVNAQSPAPHPPVFRVLGLSDSLQDIYYVENGQKIALYVSQSQISLPYDVPKERILRLFHDVQVPQPDGKPPQTVRKPLGTVPIPAGYMNSIVMLAAGQTDTGEPAVSGKAYEDSATLHPANTFAFYNFSKMPMAMNLQGKMIESEPGQIVSLPNPADKTRTLLEFQFAVKKAGQWVLLTDRNLAFRPTFRAFVIAKDEPSTNGSPIGITMVLDRALEN